MSLHIPSRTSSTSYEYLKLEIELEKLETVRHSLECNEEIIGAITYKEKGRNIEVISTFDIDSVHLSPEAYSRIAGKIESESKSKSTLSVYNWWSSIWLEILREINFQIGCLEKRLKQYRPKLKIIARDLRLAFRTKVNVIFKKMNEEDANSAGAMLFMKLKYQSLLNHNPYYVIKKRNSGFVGYTYII